MRATYHRWLEFTDIFNQYFLYMSEKQFFGKRIKRRVYKKWHHRYIEERNRKIKLYSKSDPRYCIYFGRVVYTYNKNNIHGFTVRPKQRGCRKYPLGYAIHSMLNHYVI